MSEKLPEGWVPVGKAARFIRDNLMYNNPKFVLANWDCKYINVRVDMRTGSCLMSPGNVRDTPDEFTAMEGRV